VRALRAKLEAVQAVKTAVAARQVRAAEPGLAAGWAVRARTGALFIGRRQKIRLGKA
jgi:hypothetical protein